MKNSRKALTLRPNELEAVYAISRAVAETIDFDKALAEIVRLARPVFIFDNAVLYLVSEKTGVLEPAFARAIGRGRSTEADSAWGELAANEAFDTGKNSVTQPTLDPKRDRLEQRFFLGLPLMLGGKRIGALVFIRFGGPAFAEDQINLAEYIAAHVTQVLEHKRLVERIGSLEAERRLVQLQSDFIATVSHELKTPLGFIKGYTTTLLRKDAEWDPQFQEEFLKIIDEETDHLTDLVDNLLDSSRLQSGTLGIELKNIDLAALLEENLARLRVLYPEVEFNWNAETSDSFVQADSKRLSQVIENLVSNAIKYAPNSPLYINMKRNDKRVQISIKDTGPGVPAEHAEHIFKRFYRIPDSKDKTRGSGLGLFICEQIVRAHGGEIALISAKGKGAEFIISLPGQPVPEAAI